MTDPLIEDNRKSSPDGNRTEIEGHEVYDAAEKAPFIPMADRGLNWWPLAIVLFVFCLGIALVVARHWRRGSMVMGGSLIIGSVLRTILPDEVAGLLVVRSRIVDVALLSGMGCAMIVLGLIVPGVYR